LTEAENDFATLGAWPEEPLGIRLWLIGLDARCDVDASLLGPLERARADRFAFERDRHRYLVAHVALRRLLCERGALEAGRDFEYDAYGKPRLPSPRRCVFSLSHSGGWALVGLAPDGEIGVDLELARDIGEIDALLDEHFSDAERAEYAAAGTGAASLRAFLRGWSRKEACLKALGCGFDEPASAIETGLEAGPRILWHPLGREHLVARVQTIDMAPHVVAAVARVEVWNPDRARDGS